jgi:hypothetical protein
MSASGTPGQSQAAAAARAGTARRPPAPAGEDRTGACAGPRPSARTRRGRPLAALLLSAGLLLPLPARAGAPDPLGAARALFELPLALAGDALAAAGLIAASGVALAGDGLSLLDANPATAPLLQGRPHAFVHQLAAALSSFGTGSFESLRGVDVERWPEPAAAYRDAAPGAGRFGTAASGAAALLLAPGDLAGGAALVLLRGVGARGWAERVQRAELERRIRFVGPSPAPDPAAAVPATEPSS